MKKETKNIILSILLIILVVFMDLFSKYLINHYIELGESIIIIKNFFSLTYSHNYGAAFGILNGERMFILVVSLIMLVYLIYEIKKNIKNRFMVISSSLVIGGLLGNLYDRFFLHYVRDFLDFTLFGVDTAIFNIGDSFIVIGVFLMLISLIKEEQNENKNK